ncbi:conserved hypothetical protein [Chlorobaculum parvum NCIB 8327]|uniref:Restriction endonuclease type IV Mrr domain-containing protein n=1 Tax=Chlorobaculum parvum (strain DSM 263 / NCIMB 8327) TaxID=517417 RepID=B3QL28_CHLP8|nr:hypothetical protein [Chlorobaculum parvum]ACF10816.1 conserved hypothetical protein [Chlorobaculum parvum NCIB 8327]
MKLSQIYNLGKSQAELDFVDIDPSEDLPLFLDPFFLSIKKDNWSHEATLTLRSFFQQVIDLIRVNDEDGAKALFDHLHEPNVTCLGMSVGDPRGRGVGNQDTDKIYESLLRSRAIQTGLIRDIEDNILFVDNFGKDKLSDMTTNIITKHLIEYTQNQCRLNNIPLLDGINSGFYWDRYEGEWVSSHSQMLVYGDKKLLLVPKGIVSFSKDYTPDKYYNQFVLNFLQNENLRLNSVLVQRRSNGDRYVTKKSLKETNPQSKDFLRRFTQEHPEVLEQFKEETDVDSVKNIEISDISIGDVTRGLIERLRQMPAGSETASDYHNIIIGILEIMFYPHLINPIKEREIHEGRKRIDISFDNSAKQGIFRRLSENMRIPCPYVFVECKNYSREIANPELDQIGGRFSINRGQVGFIVCRQIDNFQLFIERCRDTYRDGRGLIIPLVDQDFIDILQNYTDLNSEFIETFLSDRVREIAIN